MKKITLIAAAFIAVSFASCSKAKTCTCTSTSGNTTYTDVTSYDKIGSSSANIACPKTRTRTNGNNTSVETCVLS